MVYGFQGFLWVYKVLSIFEKEVPRVFFWGFKDLWGLKGFIGHRIYRDYKPASPFR